MDWVGVGLLMDTVSMGQTSQWDTLKSHTKYISARLGLNDILLTRTNLGLAVPSTGQILYLVPWAWHDGLITSLVVNNDILRYI